MAPLELTELSSNWKKLQAKLQAEKSQHPSPDGMKRKHSDGQQVSTRKRSKFGSNSSPSSKRKGIPMNKDGIATARPRSKSLPAERDALPPNEDVDSRPSTSHRSSHPARPAQINEGVSEMAIPGRYIALDCEMVGFGPNPDQDSQLARVSIVNYHGDQVYDSYVLPQMQVTDYRTPISGIRPHHLKLGYARPFKEVQKDVAVFLEGRVLIGHAVGGDLKMLVLNHPKGDIRDTSRHRPFRERAMGKTPSLRKLAKELLGLDIQTGEHSSIEDARVAMLLYRKEKESFDAEHSKQSGKNGVVTESQASGNAKRRKKKKKKAK